MGKRDAAEALPHVVPTAQAFYNACDMRGMPSPLYDRPSFALRGNLPAAAAIFRASSTRVLKSWWRCSPSAIIFSTYDMAVLKTTGVRTPERGRGVKKCECAAAGEGFGLSLHRKFSEGVR